MEIQDRYCHGLIASRAKIGRTVDADIDGAIPAAATSTASSGQLHLDSAIHRWQAVDRPLP